MDNFSDKIFQKKTAKWVITVVTTCLVIYLGIRYISTVGMALTEGFNLFLPLLLGLLMAMILNIPMEAIEHHLFTRHFPKLGAKLRRPLAILISLALLIGILALVIALVVPELARAVATLVRSAGDVLENAAAFSESFNWAMIPFGEELSRIEIDWQKLLNDFESWATGLVTGVSNSAANIFTKVTDFLVNFAIGAVFAIYLLANKETLKKQFSRLAHAWLPEKVDNYARHVLHTCGNAFTLFMTGQVTEAVILGLLCTLGMLILQLPYAGMVGALVCVTALIPYIGALIGGAVGVFMIAVAAPFKALIFIVFFLILQQIEGNLIYPRVVGAKISLPSLWVFAAITIGGKLAGPLGMVLAVPLAAAAYSLLREATEEREKSKAQAEEKAKLDLEAEVRAEIKAQEESVDATL